MTQNFTPDDTIEFIDYIVDVRSEPANENDKLFNIDVDSILNNSIEGYTITTPEVKIKVATFGDQE